MNKHVDIRFDIGADAGDHRPAPVETQAPRRPSRLGRIFRGGRVDDAGRLPRYALILLLSVAAIWGPIAGYIMYAPKSWTSGAMLILPGAGSSATVNLSEIGQASSAAASPFSSSAVSPTVTYKALLTSARVRVEAAEILGVAAADLPKPRVKLTDQTSLILFEVKTGGPEHSASVANAVLTAFLAELEKLRADETSKREDGFRAAIRDYRTSVDNTRIRITGLKEESGLISVEQYGRMVEEADSLGNRVRDLEAELAQRTRALEGLAAALSLTPEEAARFLKLRADPEFQVLATAMAETSAEAAAARAMYGPNHPIRQELQTALAGARGKTFARAAAVTGVPLEEVGQRVDFSGASERGALMAEMVRIKSERDGLSAELGKLSADLQTAQAKVRALVGAASALDDLGRDYQVAEAVFTSALARTNTSKTDVFASYPLVQVLEPPTAPDAPSSPHVLLAIAGGGAATVLLLIGLVLGWIRRPLIDRLIAPRAP